MSFQKLLPGDVFLTRNIGLDESNNPSPGLFNHSAIYVGNGVVVEAQDGYGIVKFKVENFFARYPIIVLLRHRRTHIAQPAAEFALTLVGKPYRKMSSIFRFQRNPADGMNCVSVVRLSYQHASKEDWLYAFPDNIFWDTTHFIEIDRKWDRHWVAPANPYDGLIKD